MKRYIRKRRGQFRIIEVLLAVAALFTAFTTSVYLTSTSRINVLQEHFDLDRIGQNTLLRLTESGVIDSTVSGSSINRELLEKTISETLPPLTYYNLTIYRATGNQIPSFDDKVGSVFNSPPNSFRSTSEVSSSSFMYTSSSGEIYYLVLALAKAG